MINFIKNCWKKFTYRGEWIYIGVKTMNCSYDDFETYYNQKFAIYKNDYKKQIRGSGDHLCIYFDYNAYIKDNTFIKL